MSAMDVQLVTLTTFMICFFCLPVAADFDENVPQQRFDGWYNNPLKPSWGGVGQPLERNITPSYEDETYRPSGRDRPNARRISNEIFGPNAGRSGYANHRNLTALFAFFGQIVQRELLDTHEVTCPVEILDTRVPAGDPDFDRETTGEKSIPYERCAYDKNSGQSPNNPRRQINQASSYIDASFLYGSSMVRSEFLREPNSGKLACHDQWGYFPLMNDVKLAFHSYAYKHMKSHELWRMGDAQAFENPAVLAMNLLFYRYHNVKALEVMERNANLSSDQVFAYARRSVIATLQKIIVYDWLPNLIGMDLPPYTGYKPSVKSDVTDIFDAGPINYIMTMIPPAIYQKDTSCAPRKYNGHRAMRLCNTYWKAMEYLLTERTGTEEILRGLSLQLAELEDTYVISDLRNKFYGPLYHSNLDLVLLTIMKGRDYGLPDYNVVRHTMGLEKKKTIQEINPELTQSNPQLIQKVVEVYKDDVSQLDMFVGGMLETTPDGPGELFTTILYDQFLRLRDGDRFWFENKDNNLFTDEEVMNIKNTTFATIMAAITQDTATENIPDDVFKASKDSQCGQSMVFTEEELESCPENEGYDFFAGSEIPYVIIWTCLGFLPLLCILVAYLLAKCKKFRLQRALKKHRSDKEKKRHLRRTMSNSISVHDATEWRGNEPGRQVELHLTTPGNLEVFTTSGSQVRSIKIGAMSNLTVHISSNKKRVAMNFIIPKEYDLVVEFPSEAIRNEFERLLCEFATGHNVNIVVMELKLQDLLAAATTKEKRNKILEKFFKTVFSEAFDMDYQPSLDSSQSDVKSHSQDILEVELSKEEFAEAMAVKSNSGFVEHFFSIIDSDRNGYISFREFLNAVVLFSKGSIQEKLQTMFHMYDIDGSGFMTKQQMGQMFISLLELAQGDLGQDNVDMLVDSLCQQVGMELRDKFSFKDFCHIFAPQMDKLWNASFDWKGLNKVMPSVPKISKPTPNTSEADLTRRRGSMGSAVEKVSTASSGAGGAAAGSGMDPGVTKVVKNFEAVRERYTPVKAKIKLVKHFIENYRQHIFFLILFYGICVGLFAERFYYYTVEQEHAGYRKLMSYGISITRGAAASMSFTFSFLLLTMCRNTITYLRSTALNQFVPFDSHVSFHKIVAWTALLFSAVHIVGYSFNFYHLVTQPTRLLCIFTSLVFSPEQRFTFQEWLFGTMTGFTGVLLVLMLCIIYVFATQTARRHIFSLFWLTHKLFIVLYVLTIIHGASVVVQKPMFFVYFTGPAILFTADKVISLSRKKTELCIIKALNLPSDVTMIEFKRPPRFEYKSGQWVRIACLAQGKDEYHPFTLTSAPHEDSLKVHIRALGPWTWNLRHTFDDDSVKDARSYPKLYLDGPYGAGQQDWYQYDVSVLVGAGIGVTPYASILKDFVHMASINMRYKVKCQKLYFIWITGSQRHFEWLIEILREVEEIDTQGMVAIDIFITQFFQNFDLRTSLLYIFEEHFQKMNGGKSVFTGLKATTHFGRPQLNKIMAAVHKTHPQARKVGVFSCGPPGVTKGVERACVDASKETKAMFEHHFENF